MRRDFSSASPSPRISQASRDTSVSRSDVVEPRQSSQGSNGSIVSNDDDSIVVHISDDGDGKGTGHSNGTGAGHSNGNGNGEVGKISGDSALKRDSVSVSVARGSSSSVASSSDSAPVSPKKSPASETHLPGAPGRFLSWLHQDPTLEGTLEKRSSDDYWASSLRLLGRGLHSFTSQLNLSRFGHTSPCPPV